MRNWDIISSTLQHVYRQLYVFIIYFIGITILPIVYVLALYSYN